MRIVFPENPGFDRASIRRRISVPEGIVLHDPIMHIHDRIGRLVCGSPPARCPR